MMKMIKIRLQGTKKDLRWFLKGLNRDSRYEIDNVSEFKKFKTSDKYHRVYVNLYRKDKQRVENRRMTH